MMEHENTKEARKKLQEYKQKLGKAKNGNSYSYNNAISYTAC